MKRILAFLMAMSMVGAACTSSSGTTTTSATTPTPAEAVTTSAAASKSDPGFYVNLMWHQHQPFYPKDENGVYTRPWVRVHATKDYYDMAALSAQYPNVQVTFNLTPVLLLQLEDLANGAKDIYWVKAEIPADQLTEDDKRFLVERFFDTNPRIIARFPRYQELADDRAARGTDGAVIDWTTGDFRDLQVLFNLAWTDPSFLAEAPLSDLVDRGRDFTEVDKATLFGEHLRIIQATIPLHARLWEEGQIEVTTTPLAHPILPLIADTNLATVGDPAALLPAQRFQEIPDADQQVIRGLDTAERLLGRRPVGMWPGEGSVAQLVMSLFSKNGVQWVASGEEVLAKSLGIGSFERNASDMVSEPTLLYRPWEATLRRNDPVPMFFRDGLLSDLVGFEYSGMSGEAAADDLMRRLADIHDAVGDDGGPYVVSIILDGENAWEHYENDGIDFLSALYERLDSADWVGTITPSEYLSRFGEPEALDEVWPGAWFQPNFATWIGEEEEATAWDYLAKVRADLETAQRSGNHAPDALEGAFEKMLFAEGSDWFWWYGSDQESGNDDYFDGAFRELLGQVYDALGEPRPDFVSVPIIPQPPVTADRQQSDLLSFVIDGRNTSNEWNAAGSLDDSFPGGLHWAVDRRTLALHVGMTEPFTVILGTGSGETFARSPAGVLLGYGGTDIVSWDGSAAFWCPGVEAIDCVQLDARAGEGTEIALPLDLLPPLESGDRILMKIEASDALTPADGPVAMQVPDLSNVDVALRIDDPVGDDHGPGTYSYPTDGVFVAGAYDLTLVEVGTEGEDVVIAFEVVAPIQNPWGSPNGLSIQTFDLYIDLDPGDSSGERMLIDGRNAALPPDFGWEYAVTVEGWEPAIYVVRADGTVEETRPSFDIVVFPEKGRVVIRVPREILGDSDPAGWGIAAAVLSQEGFPSSGVRRVRDVEGAAQQWRIGGGTGAANESRILDVAWPVAGDQEALLSDFVATTGSIDDLAPDDFPRVPVFVAP